MFNRFALTLSLIGTIVSSSLAANRTWQGNTNSDWGNSSNWQWGLIAGANDSARINLSSNDPEISAGNYQIKYLYLPYETQPAGSAEMIVSGGGLAIGKTLSLSATNIHSSTMTITDGEVSCQTLMIGENGLVDLAGGQLRLTDVQAPRARMSARLAIDQGRLVAYGGAGRIKWGSEGSDVILTGELTDALAKAPNPADLTTQVTSGAPINLSWTAGAGATSHNVYFSSVADEVLTNDVSSAFQGNQTSTNFTSGTLLPNTVYYWRVDEVAGSVTNRGDVWSFRTDEPTRNRPTLGVIRWDMYSGEGATQQQELGYLPGEQAYLAPEQWNWRAPFFCRYTNDVPWIDHAANGATSPLWFNYPFEYSRTQDATDQEIAFAGTAGAGLDYWIFGTAPASVGGWGLHWNLDALLESERRLEINYAMMYRMDAFDSWSELDQTIDEMIWQAKQPNYQTVINGRPIFYFIHYKKFSKNLGDPTDGSTVTNLAAAVRMMRDAFSMEGLPDPYLVATAVPAHSRNDGNWIDGAGFDAGNDYRGGYGGSPDPGTTFADMPDNIEPYWDLNRDHLSAGLVPAAPCGANSLPREPHGLYNYDEPVPGDLTALMNRVMSYIDNNPVECEANTFTMYSWNEHSEGGFLCPLINTNGNYDQPDTWRLDEVGAAVNAHVSPFDPVLVMVRADGWVYYSASDQFAPEFALDLTPGGEAVVAAAAEGAYVYGLLGNGDVVRADMLSTNFLDIQTLGTFSSTAPMVGIDVRFGSVFAVDNDGRVYKNFGGSPLITLNNDNYVDLAVQSASTFRGLCRHEGARTWTRDESNTYANYHNTSAGVAIANEAGSGYYVLNDNGQVYGPDTKILQTTFGSGWTDLTVAVDTSTNFYCIASNGVVNHAAVGGSISTLGSAAAGASEFVALDWITELPAEPGIPPAGDERPNVIVILSDDHGFTDLGIYGIDPNVQTPTMDYLAANGAYMTHGYVTAPQCVPSRAGMITGSYQFRYGVLNNNVGYLPLTDPYGSNVVTHAEDMKAAGYATGLVGKWHLNRSDAADPTLYNPRNRGFDDYFYGFHSDFEANFDPTNGSPVAIDTIYNHAHGPDGRVLIQGEAACTFIENHKDEPFYLYYSPYGPHTPRLSSTYEAVTNFPAVDYPMYDAAEDQVRREGLALIKMVDDSISNIVRTLRENGLEENTLILFVSDNGAQPKLWDTVNPSVSAWDGSENVPRRGEKGSLFEGGINVPMWAYWKGEILPGQVIEESVISLDFMATAMRLATTNIPARYDGVDLMPRLRGQTNVIERAEPLYWNWGQSEHQGEVAIRKGDWKLRRSGEGDFVFNLESDPNELTNLVHQLPAKTDELATDLETFIASLPPEGRVTRGATKSADNYIHGPNETGVVDARYLGGAVYPLAIETPNTPMDTDGDGMLDDDEIAVGRNPYSAADMAFYFEGPGDYRYYSRGTFEGWHPVNMDYMASTNGMLEGTTGTTTARAMRYDLGFDANEVPSLLIRMRAAAGSDMRFYWATETNNGFDSSRRVFPVFHSNRWETILLPMDGMSQWNGETITQFRLQPTNAETDFEIDYIAASTGDLDLDGMSDADEVEAGTDAARADSIFTLVPTVDGNFQWNGRDGRAYTVWNTPTLEPVNWTVATNIGVLTGDQLIDLALPSSPTSGFYRVEVTYP